MLVFIMVLSVCTTVTSSMEGISNFGEWAYQWYTDEPFRFQCHIAGLNITEADHVLWETPGEKTLESPHNDTDYQLHTRDNIVGIELLVKKVHSSMHGVYICTVENGSQVIVGRTIYGLNIHEMKYHDMMDKYRHQLYVALVATAVFVVFVLTICLVWNFRYITPEMEAKRQERKRGKLATNGHLAESVKSPEGNGAYENPEAFTQL